MAAFLERGQTKIPGVTQNQRLALARAILALPERQRQALVLRHFEGMSNPAIGERLDCSVEAGLGDVKVAVAAEEGDGLFLSEDVL